MKSNNKIPVLVCIDAGGTKTRINIYDLDGVILNTSLIGVGSPAITKDLEFLSIDKALKEIFKKFDELYEFKNITMGISGLGVHPDVVPLERKFKEKFNCPVYIVNDAIIALYAVTCQSYSDIINHKEKEGILVLGGTGSAICGMKNSKTQLIGGWGHIIGEYGSAYSLVHHACQRLIMRFEHSMALLELDKKLLSAFEINDPFKLKSIFYLRTKGEIASFASIISTAALNGDEEALTIMKNEASLIVDGIIRLVNKQNIENGSILGFKGGLFKNNKIIPENVDKMLKEKNLSFNLLIDEQDPIIGAYYLSKTKVLMEG
ncbi:MAG: ROK family protein [Bacilli bacterium]|nr:ROK family protein [Bacilli bacterium]